MDSSTPEQDIVIAVGHSNAKYILLSPSAIYPDKICFSMNIRRGRLEEKDCANFPFLEPTTKPEFTCRSLAY